MNHKQSIEACQTLIRDSEAVYFSTIGPEGFPNIRAMLNLANPNLYPGLASFFNTPGRGLSFFFTTNTSSAKVAQIENDPRAAVYYCDPASWRGVMVCGMIEIVQDMDIKKSLWQEPWTMYYPGGAEDPDYAILKLNPVFIRGYHQLENYEILAGDLIP